MARVEREHESVGAWTFEVRLDSGRTISVRLSWADYNLWSADGRMPPADVARAVVQLLIDRDGEASLRDRFDAAIVRRLHRDADDELPRRIAPSSPD